MPNKLEQAFDNSGGATKQVQIIEKSHTGRAQLSVFIAEGGALGGATIKVQKQLVMRDGTKSAIRDIGSYTEEIDLSIDIGQNNNLWVEVTNMTSSTDLICKASTLK